MALSEKKVNLDFRHSEARWQRLLELVYFVSFFHDKSVQIFAAANFELGVPLVLLLLKLEGGMSSNTVKYNKLPAKQDCRIMESESERDEAHVG